jgi:hypothetical protein
MQGMINLEQEIVKVGFVGPGLGQAYALTSVDCLNYIDLASFMVSEKWEYDGDRLNDEDRFMGLDGEGDGGEFKYFCRKDGWLRRAGVRCSPEIGFGVRMQGGCLLKAAVSYKEGIVGGYDNGVIEYYGVNADVAPREYKGLIGRAADEMLMDDGEDQMILESKGRKIKGKYRR